MTATKTELGSRKKLYKFGHSLGVIIPFREIKGKKAGDFVTIIVDPEEQDIYQSIKEIKEMLKHKNQRC